MKLSQLRKQNKLTQQVLAQQIGLDQSSVSKMENGKVKPSFETTLKLSKALNVDTSIITSCFLQ